VRAKASLILGAIDDWWQGVSPKQAPANTPAAIWSSRPAPLILIFFGSATLVLAVSIGNQLKLGYPVRSEWYVLIFTGLSFLALLMLQAQRSAFWRLRLTIFSFSLGVFAGAAVRYHFGKYLFNIHDFCDTATPLIAALLLGIVFVGADQMKQLDQKRLGLLYVVLGIIGTAFGNIPFHGASWLFGVCYLAVCGSLASSAYVVMAVARTWT
jgi:hypothetical protein